jgi:hypothetical protein
MKARSPNAIAAAILCLLLLVQAIPAQSPRTADKVAYKDGDGKWRIVALKDLEGRPKIPPSQSVKAVQGVTFNLTYRDVVQDTNVGFDDPALGADRRATLQAVLSYISGLLELETGTCDIEVAVSQTDGAGPLASCGPFQFVAPGFSNGFAYLHIKGPDPSPVTDDMVLTVDFGYPWNNDTGPVGPTEFDLFSVLLHELTHGLGMLTLISATGASELGPQCYSVYDSYLHTPVTQGVSWLIDPQTFTFVQPLSYLTSAVQFEGPEARAAFGPNLRVYTPSPFRPGSSLGHWNDTITPRPVMAPALSNGTQVRAYQPFELGALADLGYQIGSKPPVLSVRPGTWQRMK